MSVNKNTRNEIIVSAKKLFGLGGFEYVSMSQIAKDVGISKASLYYFFKDKVGIYCAVVEDLINDVSDVFYQAGEKKGNETFTKIIERAIKISISEGSTFMRLDIKVGHIKPEQEKKIYAMLRDFFQKVENFLKSYNINEPKLATHVLLSSIHSYVKETCLGHSKISVKLYSKYLESLFIKNNQVINKTHLKN